MDESIIQEFLNETKEFLEKLDTELVRLEDNPEHQELIDDIFRMVHTIKGTSGFLGFERLGAVTHAGENILSDLRDGKLKATPEIISGILGVVDVIKEIVQGIEKEQREPAGDDSKLIERLVKLKDAPDESAEVPKPKEEAVEEEKPPAEEEPVQNGVKEGPDPLVIGGAGAQNIRVNVQVLENLMHHVSELVLTRNQLLQMTRNLHHSELQSPLQRLSYITTELQEGIMKTRMQPIGHAWAQFPRMVRDLSREFGKKITLHMEGQETELDRQLIELIKDPLTHMIRNSVDHGIETTQERIELDKPEVGNIHLKAYHKGGHIFMEISDDGKGLDVGKIKRRALQSGIVNESDLSSLSEQQIQQYIFKPGFSTAEQVTSISGRGVGMDVVRHNIEKISGLIECNSIMGRGTTFIIKIPLTLAIMSVLLVQSRNVRFGIPQISVVEMLKTSEGSEYEIEKIHDQAVLRLRDQLIPLIYLSDILELERDNDNANAELDSFVVICEVGNVHFGVIVDRVFDSEEIVVKPVSHLLRHVDIYSGSTLLGDGSIIMVLDPNGLIRHVNKRPVLSDRDIMLHQKLEGADTSQGTRFLQFRVGNDAPKLVPLGCITRLEEMDLSGIEKMSGNHIMQYRGGVLHIETMDPSIPIPTSGVHEIVVISEQHHMMGLIVDEVLDIVEKEVDHLSYSNDDPYCGVVVVDDTACDVVNIDYHFYNLFQHWEGGSISRGMLSSAPHILLVDDSPFFQKIIPPTLESHGYRVSVASTTLHAMEILLAEDAGIDLVIVDMHMPEKNGEEFAQECRAKPTLKDLPIIALSPQLPSAEEKQKMSLNGVTCKTNHDHLIHTIRDVFSKKMEESDG